jgi:hypothetical protein
MKPVITIMRQKGGDWKAVVYDAKQDLETVYSFEFSVCGFLDDIQIDWIEAWDSETGVKASEAIAQVANDPEWRARQTGSELAAFGAWLDQTAFAIGDRLSRRTGDGDDDSPRDGG